MQQGHGFYNSSIVSTCEKHGYRIALGSLFPMDHMFQNQAKRIVKNMLWRVRFIILLVGHSQAINLSFAGITFYWH